VEGFGVLTVTKPFEPFYFYNMMKVAIAVQYKVQTLSSQTIKLKSKMEEIRLMNRAKMLLMQNLKMTEQEAHHHLEKEAMNRGMKRTAIADEIIRTYG
ncbi:MAG: ANTAR domain-containing protein, partial [Treponema sp.]|nr:ANTAR domain-containing protein [Treponema sp.]